MHDLYISAYTAEVNTFHGFCLKKVEWNRQCTAGILMLNLVNECKLLPTLFDSFVQYIQNQRAYKSRVRVYKYISFTCISEKLKKRTQQLLPKPNGKTTVISNKVLNPYSASKF